MVDFAISYGLAGLMTTVLALLWAHYIRNVDLVKEFRDQVWWRNAKDILLMVVLWPFILGLIVATHMSEILKNR